MNNNYEIEVLDGLEEFAEQELTQKFGQAAKIIGRQGRGRIAIQSSGDLRLLNSLKSVTAVYAVEDFLVPRPKALLGNQNLNRILETVQTVLRRNRDKEFKTLRVSGAGADSSVFTRLKQEIAGNTGLKISEEPANLQVTIRHSPKGDNSWQVLVRTSSMPLSSREWRIQSFPGALNATIAHVMDSLANPKPGERFLNLCCGSGTLMIERLEIGPAKVVVGIDHDEGILEYASINLKASGHHSKAELMRGDIGSVPLPNASFDTIVADLPYGMLVGNEDIEQTYRSAIAEATRVASRRASLLMITTRKSLFESSLDNFRNYWENVQTIPVSVPHKRGYLKTAIYWLKRKA